MWLLSWRNIGFEKSEAVLLGHTHSCLALGWEILLPCCETCFCVDILKELLIFSLIRMRNASEIVSPTSGCVCWECFQRELAGSLDGIKSWKRRPTNAGLFSLLPLHTHGELFCSGIPKAVKDKHLWNHEPKSLLLYIVWLRCFVIDENRTQTPLHVDESHRIFSNS